MLKVLHSSDFHLGKKLYKRSREDEHSLFLSWIESQVKSELIDILIIAGDVFDSPIPPTSALKAYFDFLNKISEVNHLKKIIIISGNHDSGHFLEAPLSFLSRQKIHIAGQIFKDDKIDQNYIDFTIKNEKLRIASFPFFRAHDFIKEGDNLSEQSPEDLLTKNLSSWLSQLKQNHKGPSLLIGHHLFGSFFASGSEQTVSLSGLDSLPLDLFNDWDVLALGHIHKKQILRKTNPLAIYSGSPIAMRFSESLKKSIYQYTFCDEGIKDYKEIPIPCSRLLKRINVTINNYQKAAEDIAIEQSSLPLTSFLELSIHLRPEENIIIDDIVKVFKEKNIEVLNMIVNYNTDSDEEAGPKLEDLFILGPKELFSQYLDDNEVSKEAQKELLNTFEKVLLYEESNTEGKPEVYQ